MTLKVKTPAKNIRFFNKNSPAKIRFPTQKR